MNFLRKLFGSANDRPAESFVITEGDIFYSHRGSEYRVYKLLKYDLLANTFHVKAYQQMATVPRPEDLADLPVLAHHVPIADTGFGRPHIIANEPVSYEDLIGYFEYLRQTQNIDEIVNYATHYYKQHMPFLPPESIEPQSKITTMPLN